MERETIIKALECCSKDDCDNCPNSFGNCYSNLAGYALALIKELTEKVEAYRQELGKVRVALNNANVDNKRLTEENERLTINMNAYGLTAKRLAEENERLKAEVSVKKKLLDKCVDLEDRVKADTVREFAERLKAICRREIIVPSTIDRIAEEMLGKECTDCKHFAGCEPSTLGVCDMYEEEEKK